VIKRVLILLITLLVAKTGLVYANQADNHLRALFLYNFANYVEWPDSAFTRSHGQLHMCLFGEIEFLPMISVYDGTLIGERQLNVFQTTKLKEIEKGCHILFVSRDKRIELPNFFNQIKYTYVLSIGERKDFSAKGGIVSIVRTSDRVQFDINLTAAMANRLTISSDLLSLARKIRRLK